MTGVTIGLWVYLINNGRAINEARNLLLLLMVIFQNMHVFNCRSEKISAFRMPVNQNYFLFLGVFGALGLHIAVMYIPFMQKLLSIGPVNIQWWGIIAGLAFSIIVVMEIFKLVKRRLTGNI